MHLRAGFCAWLMVVPLASGATSICRWLDDSGHTQMSDAVPEVYRQRATCIDAHQYELTPLQQRDADERNAALQAQLRAAEVQRETAIAPAPMPPAGAASAPNVKRPLQPITDATDCPTRWRLYDESSDCFGSYRSVGGGIKPEALEWCNVIASPEVNCGPRRN